jgi:probable rRNA maturation factor
MKSDPLISFRRKPATLDTEALQSFAETLRLRVAKRAEFHCLITGDAELQQLNQQYRGKDEPTDVLSFPGEAPYLGDIAVSMARARAQAKQFGHTPDDELRILMLHGVLHLTGLDHETDSGQMARAEQRWRKKLGLSTSLTERSK